MKLFSTLPVRSLLLLAVFPVALRAQEGADERKQSVFDLLSHGRELIRFDLETDLFDLEEKRFNEDYQPGKVSFKDGQGNRRDWDIEVRIRGKMRRRICNFPPIKLKFDKEELKSLNLKKHNELKLVTHCLEDREGKDILLREYLAYKLYEALSPVHYRAQLIRIRYIDPDHEIKAKRFAFILEDEQELAARYDTELCEEGCFSMTAEHFDSLNLQMAGLFEYMIGNTDWSIRMARNVKLLRQEKGGLFYVVPYDFDFSGLVNASYAIPDPSLNLESVRDRYFLGMAESEADLQPAIEVFREKRADLVRIIEDFRLLKKKSRKDILRFLDQFYELSEKNEVLAKGEKQ